MRRSMLTAGNPEFRLGKFPPSLSGSSVMYNISHFVTFPAAPSAGSVKKIRLYQDANFDNYYGGMRAFSCYYVSGPSTWKVRNVTPDLTFGVGDVTVTLATALDFNAGDYLGIYGAGIYGNSFRELPETLGSPPTGEYDYAVYNAGGNPFPPVAGSNIYLSQRPSQRIYAEAFN